MDNFVMKPDTANKPRNCNLDIVRIVAVLTVIMSHVTSGYFSNYGTDTSEFAAANIFNSISRIGVPLFVMLSGALLLDENRNISTRDMLNKIKGIALLLIFWSAAYSVLFNAVIPLLAGNEVNIKSVVSGFIFGYSHLWFLYMLIGLYFAAIFLRFFVARKNSKLVLLFIAISLLAQFTLPVLRIISGYFSEGYLIIRFINMFYLQFFGGYAAYYLIGWYIVHIGINKKIVRYLAYVASVASAAVIILYVAKTADRTNAYNNLNIVLCTFSVGVFLLICNIRINFKEKTKRLLMIFSNLSFGAYITHKIFIFILTTLCSYEEIGISIYLYCIIVFVISTAVSFAVCALMAKIPLIKSLIRV